MPHMTIAVIVVTICSTLIIITLIGIRAAHIFEPPANKTVRKAIQRFEDGADRMEERAIMQEIGGYHSSAKKMFKAAVELREKAQLMRETGEMPKWISKT